MDDKQFADALRDVLAATDGDSDDINQTTIRRIHTFEEVGVLSRDAGLVVTLTDGSEFQLTVVRSRVARG
ncbi:MAG: hypothetical protein ACREAA_04865 [Candidatus Polarisedimenticolia bacterium]